MDKKQARLRRARKTRARIAELKMARLSVHRTNCHIYAQIIDETGSRVLAQASTLEAEVKKELANGGNAGAGETRKSAGYEAAARFPLQRFLDRSG